MEDYKRLFVILDHERQELKNIFNEAAAICLNEPDKTSATYKTAKQILKRCNDSAVANGENLESLLTGMEII